MSETANEMFEKEKMPPLFTVAVITYLQRNFLDECIDSILSQTYPAIEIVVCDDCSADFDADSVRKYIDENKGDNVKRVVVYKQEHNVGTTANAQKAVELSTGRYLKLHAGDDLLYHDQVLGKMAHYFRDPSTDIIAARSVACMPDGTLTDHYYPSHSACVSMMSADAAQQFRMIGAQAWGEYINAPAVFWRRGFFNEMGGFDLSYKYTEDWPMWLKITGKGHRISMVKDVTTIYRYGGISNNASILNSTLGQIHYQECIRMLREYALPRFEEQHDTMMAFRCRHSIHCIEMRIIGEVEWNNWDIREKLAWRFREARFMAVAWMYRKKKYGFPIGGKKLLIAMLFFLLLYTAHAQIWPGVDCGTAWAAAFFGAAALLSLKICMAAGIKAAGLLIDVRKGKFKR